jgi:hypothetical protein
MSPGEPSFSYIVFLICSIGKIYFVYSFVVVKVISSSVLFYVPLLHTGLTDWFVVDLRSGERLHRIMAEQSYFVQAVNDKLIEFKDVRSDPSVVRLLVFTPLADTSE